MGSRTSWYDTFQRQHYLPCYCVNWGSTHTDVHWECAFAAAFLLSQYQSTPQSLFSNTPMRLASPPVKYILNYQCTLTLQESRRLATIPLLRECLPRDKCLVLRGKRFASSKWAVLVSHRVCYIIQLHRNPVLQMAMKAPNTYLLFPGNKGKQFSKIIIYYSWYFTQLLIFSLCHLLIAMATHPHLLYWMGHGLRPKACTITIHSYSRYSKSS